MNWKKLNIQLTIAAFTLFVLALLINDPLGFFDYSYDKSPFLMDQSLRRTIKTIKVEENNILKYQLQFNNSKWIINDNQNTNFFADSAKVDSNIDKLFTLRKFNKISSNIEKYSEFGVADNQLKITLTGENKEVVIFPGNQGSTYNSSLVRLLDDKSVYLVKGNLKQDWNQSVDSFRDKKIFQFTADNISMIKFSGIKNYKFERNNENSWKSPQAPANKKVSEERFSKLLEDITSLEGNDYFNDKNIGRKVANIEIELKTNTTESLEIYKNSANTYLMKSNYNSYWMTLPEYKLNNIFISEQELFVSADQEQK